MPTKTPRNHQNPPRAIAATGDQQTSLQEAMEQGTMQGFAEYARTCVRANPEAAALWCFGIGFVLGWKLKPW